MEGLSGILSFVRAAELGSFTRASKALGVTASGVGKSITRLEAELGVRLLHRTTRRLSMTDEGAVFFEHCRRVLDDLESARTMIANRGTAPSGRLRVSLPITLGKKVVIPALPKFMAKHPHISLDIRLSDRKVNLIEDGIDAVLRVGKLSDASLVARRVGEQQLLTVASPAYLAREPIASLGDLTQRRCMTFRSPSSGRDFAWMFRIDGRTVEWQPRPFLQIDDGEALVEAVKAGLGVCQAPHVMLSEGLASGALVEVLSHLRPEPDVINVVYMSQRHLPARTRAFVDFATSLKGLHPDVEPASMRAPRSIRGQHR